MKKVHGFSKKNMEILAQEVGAKVLHLTNCPQPDPRWLVVFNTTESGVVEVKSKGEAMALLNQVHGQLEEARRQFRVAKSVGEPRPDVEEVAQTAQPTEG